MQRDADGRPRYREAGVDVAEGDRAVGRYRELVRATRPEVLGGIGGFYGAFRLDDRHTLVASADGAGTKVLLAAKLRRYDTVGIDLVAMNVNDILTAGAEPLFFLDYLAVGRLDADVAARIVAGVDAGCAEAGCALLGGETAEMPGVYRPEEWDLAGFAVGRVVADRVEPPPVSAGQAVIGVASSGFHANGFSLVRRILDETGLDLETRAPGGSTWGEALLAPTRIYVRAVLSLIREVPVAAMAHITGGGIGGNLVRVLDGLGAELDPHALPVPPEMEELRTMGGVSEAEMRQVWNAGVGFCLVVPQDAQAAAIDRLAALGHAAAAMGRVTREPGVRFQ